MPIAPPTQPARHPHRVLFLVAGTVTFCIPLLMGLGDFAAWVPPLNRALVVVLLLLSGAAWLRFRPIPIPEIRLFIAFVAWAGLSGIMVAQDENAFLKIFARVAGACGLAIAVAGICQVTRNVTIPFAAVLVVALGLAAYSWKSGFFAIGFDAANVTVKFPWNANTFGVVMLTGVFALAHLWGVRKAMFLRPLIPFLAIALAFALVSSASRKSFLALLVFSLLWLWFCHIRHTSRNLLMLLVAIPVLVGGYYFATYALQNSRLGVRLSSTGEDSGDYKRLNMYEALPVLLAINPVAGVGLGNYGVHAHALTGSYAYSHSDYVEVPATTGLVGAALYFPIYILWWRRLARLAQMTDGPEVRYQARLFQAILLTMLLLAFGVPNFMQTEQWYWMAAMLGYTYAFDLTDRSRRDAYLPWRKHTTQLVYASATRPSRVRLSHTPARRGPES